jgi:hypothetical protein
LHQSDRRRRLGTADRFGAIEILAAATSAGAGTAADDLSVFADTGAMPPVLRPISGNGGSGVGGGNWQRVRSAAWRWRTLRWIGSVIVAHALLRRLGGGRFAHSQIGHRLSDLLVSAFFALVRGFLLDLLHFGSLSVLRCFRSAIRVDTVAFGSALDGDIVGQLLFEVGIGVLSWIGIHNGSSFIGISLTNGSRGKVQLKIFFCLAHTQRRY